MRTRSSLALVAASTLSLLPACAAPPRGPAPEAPLAAPATGAVSQPGDDIDAAIERLMERVHVPGMGVAIVRRGKIEKLRGYGVANLELPAPVTPETRFQIASATKLFTGTLLMLLVQEGKLGLDDPISRHLPDAPAAWSAITVRHLAAHTSGIVGEVAPVMTTVEQAYQAQKAVPLRFEPGAEAAYNNADFVVLTHILEKVSGQPFQDLLRARILAPLGLACTAFEHASQSGLVRSADVLPGRATVYRFTQGRQRSYAFLYPEHTYASGGLFSCLPDLAKWAIAMDEGKLLSPESERVAATSFPLKGGRPAGFGVAFSTGELHGRKTYGHSGGPALADVLRVPDEGLTVIVLANQQRLFPNVAPALASLLLPPAPEPPGIADASPALTAAHRAVVEQMTTGEIAEGPFAPPARAELVPALREWGPVQTAVLPPLTRLALVEDRREGDQRARAYLAAYGPRITVRWIFKLDAAERILELEPRME